MKQNQDGQMPKECGDKKPQKQKNVPIDDGRSFADMSEVPGGLFGRFKLGKTPSPSSLREKWDTFFTVFRMMLLPTLLVAGILALGYFLLWLGFGTK